MAIVVLDKLGYGSGFMHERVLSKLELSDQFKFTWAPGRVKIGE
jgi:hypothetical protein